MKQLYFILFIFISVTLSAQHTSYTLTFEPVEIPEFGGVQSFTFAQHGVEILIIGGRLDGLHQRQPFAAFDEDGNNAQAIVINPTSKQIWKADYRNLTSKIKEQLVSTNMQFYQEDEYLILTGGYAYSPSLGDHTTFPYITVVDVPELIEEVKSNSITNAPFQQIQDDKFAVCGGQLDKIEDTYYLVGGHRFEGRYNPIGPDHGPGFVQEYTHEIRKFDLQIEESNVNVVHLPAIHDEMHLRRRDYNLMPQIHNGNEELMLFSGVFQKNVDLPWLYPISIDKNSHTAHEDFKQYFNHYHSGNLPIYNASDQEMHNIFLGGIAQFYLRDGELVQDNDVPFVKTIADVIRYSNGEMQEIPLANTMPDYLGAGSELIINTSVQVYGNGVIKGDDLDYTPIEIGYLLGGIKSSAPNIFFSNTGTQSEANATLFKVIIQKIKNTATIEQNFKNHNLLIYPNPASSFTNIGFNLKRIISPIEIEIHNLKGESIDKVIIPKDQLRLGRNSLRIDELRSMYGMYLYTVKIEGVLYKRWVHWSE